MPGIRSVVYTLHLWPPIAHAKHYTGKPGSSRFLKVQLAAVDRELAELSVVSTLLGLRVDGGKRRPDCGQARVARREMIGLSGMSAQVISK